MILSIFEIEAPGRDVAVQFELEPLSGPSGEPVPVRWARLAGHVAPGKRGLDFEGRVDAELTLQCSRCLEPFTTAISGAVQLTLVADAVEYAVGEAQIHEEDTSLFYATEGKVDLRWVTTEQLYLQLPMKPVCRPDCRGLCPHCGANRNVEPCACRASAGDPRLAPLAELLRRGE